MANRVPLIVDTSTLFIKELPEGDNLDLTGSGIVGLAGVGGTTGNFSGIVTASAFYVDSNVVLTNGRELSNIASVDATTKATLESALQTGPNNFDYLNVTGVSTFSSDLDINAAIDVDGHTELDELNVAGIATFTNATDNTLGDSNTGALQIDGGLGVDKNVTIGGNLNVQGYSVLVGVVTFKGGTINIGDANTDDINVAGEFISSLIPNDDDSYDLGSDSKQWRNIYIDGQAEIDDHNVAGITTTIQFNVGAGGTVITTTETGLVGINSTAPTTTLDVDGTINSSTDVTINGTSVITTATNDAVALAIALG